MTTTNTGTRTIEQLEAELASARMELARHEERQRETISERALQEECESIAQGIFDGAMGDADESTAEDMRDAMNDQSHEECDGHQWVIYHHKAHQLCLNCNTDSGESFLDDTGTPETPTYDGLASLIAYGEMLARVQAHLSELVDAWMAENDGGAS